METSPVLVAPGLRTLARPGWRARTISAVAEVARRPSLWVIGMLGFSLRGGVLVLALPMIVFPTQVEVRLLLGTNLGSTGFTDGFWSLVALASVVIATILLGIIVALGLVERAAFERLMEQRRLPPGPRRRLLWRLIGVQLLAAAALAACALPVALAVGQATFDEIVRPSSALSIYARVVDAVSHALFWFVLALVVVEMIAALTTRDVLARASRPEPQSSLPGTWLFRALTAAVTQPLRSPLRTFATAGAGWAVTAAVVGAAMGMVALVWPPVRAVFLATVSSADLAAPGTLLVAGAFGAVFALAMLASGFASAVRSAFWSVERFS